MQYITRQTLHCSALNQSFNFITKRNTTKYEHTDTSVHLNNMHYTIQFQYEIDIFCDLILNAKLYLFAHHGNVGQTNAISCRKHPYIAGIYY